MLKYPALRLTEGFPLRTPFTPAVKVGTIAPATASCVGLVTTWFCHLVTWLLLVRLRELALSRSTMFGMLDGSGVCATAWPATITSPHGVAYRQRTAVRWRGRLS